MNIWDLCPFLPNKHRVSVALHALTEKIRGLDFTMPDRMYNRHRNDGAMYYASSKNMLDQIFSLVDREKYSRFLDVGSGKGFVLAQAKQYGFSQVGGVEYDEALCEICRHNLERLGITQGIQVYQGDACTFTGYGDYDVFYFYNPFKAELMDQVIRRIVAQCPGREIMLIYYRPRYTEAIEGCGFFRKEHVLYDKETNYEVFIYSGKIPE